jgi:hypothetical protein
MKDVVGRQLFFENGFDIVVARDVVFSSDGLAKIKDYFACISDGGFERTVTICSAVMSATASKRLPWPEQRSPKISLP